MITVQNLTKRYGDLIAVNNISFGVSQGEVVGFLGPNGAGKTTTMRLITGFLGADGGTIEIDGKSLAADPAYVRGQIGYLPENNPLYPEMTVLEYLDFIGEMRGIAPVERGAAVRRAIERFGLIEKATADIGELSKGYRQRVGLAQAGLADPPIMILDEPTSGLDPNQIVEIRNLIKEIGRTKTVILSTHNLAEVEATCSRILIINKGRLVADDTPEQLESRTPGALLHLRLRGDDDALNRLLSIDGVVSLQSDEADGEWRRVALVVEGGEEVAEDVFDICVRHGWKLTELRREATSLEDIFTQITLG